MTAWHTLGLCTALAVSVLLLCGAGATLLRLLKATKVSAFDTFLFSAAAWNDSARASGQRRRTGAEYP